MSSSGISRRIQQCLDRYALGDYEGALVNLFPAIDKTASKRRPKTQVGQRMRGFLDDEMPLITFLSNGGIIKGLSIDGMTMEQAIYKFGRTSIMHEGEIDSRLSFTDSNSMKLSNNDWRFPKSFILSMTISVILAPENSGESIDPYASITIRGKRFIINDCWGKPDAIYNHLNSTIGRQVFPYN